jgi:hypothetical protein
VWEVLHLVASSCRGVGGAAEPAQPAAAAARDVRKCLAGAGSGSAS